VFLYLLVVAIHKETATSENGQKINDYPSKKETCLQGSIF
jgi:hypothetical protein